MLGYVLLKAAPRFRPFIRALHAVAPGLLICLAAWLALAVAHVLVAMAVAVSLAWITSWELLPRFLSGFLDDVHAPIALRLLGDIHVDKVAVGLPGGDYLAEVFPSLFAPTSYLASGAWIGATFTSGSSAIGVHVVLLAVNLAFIAAGAVGAALVARRQTLDELWSLPRPILAALCCVLLAQAYGITALLNTNWVGGGGGQLVSLIATKLLGMDGTTYDGMISGAGGILSFGINLALVVFGLLFALKTRWALHIALPPSVRSGWGPDMRWLVLPSRVPGPLMLTAAFVLFQTPLKARPAYELAPTMASATVNAVPAAPVANVDRPRVRVVAIKQTRKGFSYSVDGVRKWVRGIGYNALTLSVATGEDAAATRAEIYDRDFALIRALGANTIIGWNQREFDMILLNKAEEHGLGVILPFEFDPLLDYADPEMQFEIRERLRAWVERYKSHPALRLWGIGNETIHAMKDPVSPRARAFAQFLIGAADYVHALDPNHPVIYRDSEDQYLESVAEALAADGVARPWFVYGMNFFTYRMDEALQKGPTTRLQQPLLISEFAPAGLRPADRPVGYVKQWKILRSYPDRVLGGCAYVWTTRGPEPLDRSFGLTNGDGEPVNGAFFALAATFQEDAQTTANVTSP